MAREVTAATRMVIVCNPNNPTATALPPAAIDEFVGAAAPPRGGDPRRGLRRVLDRSRTPTSRSTCSKRHPNLILLRTFSKVYGLCGLRVGYALGSEEFRLAVDRVRQPFSVNALAQAAATEALNHQDEVERRVERTAIERVHVESELEERGLETTDSQANFSWVSLGDRDEDEIVDGLAKQGVIVRAGTALGAGGLDARHLRHARRRTTASSPRWTNWCEPATKTLRVTRLPRSRALSRWYSRFS